MSDTCLRAYMLKFDVSIVVTFKGVVNCQNSRDKGPPAGNSARG